MNYQEKLQKILNHYGKEYQEKRFDIEFGEFLTSITEKNMNDVKKELSLYKKEKFEIKSDEELIENIHSELADCCVILSQVENTSFTMSYTKMKNFLNENEYKEKIDMYKVEKIFYEKIDRQLERIADEL